MFEKIKSINVSILLLWVGHLISHAGDAIYQIALPWLILEMTGSKTITSMIAFSVYLPALLFSLPAGVFADRYSRKKVMIYSDVIRMGLILSLVFFLFSGTATPVIIGLIAFFVASAGTLFYPARDSIIPSLVRKNQLTSANAFISTSGQFAHLTGPVLAALLVSVVGLFHLFTIDAVSFGASMICIALIRSSGKTITNNEKRATHVYELKEGLQFLFRFKPLAYLILLTAINNLFIMGPAMIGTPIFVREVLNLEFSAFATVEAFMASGMIIGSLIVWKFCKNINPSRVLFWGMILDGLTYSILFFIHTYTSTKLLLFIHGIGIPMITISRTTIIQTVVPDHLRGRLFSMVNLSVIGFTALSAGIIGPVAEFVPIGTIFLFIGIGAALCGVAGFSHRGMMSVISNKP